VDDAAFDEIVIVVSADVDGVMCGAVASRQTSVVAVPPLPV
jgi:hypothetical protein